MVEKIGEKQVKLDKNDLEYVNFVISLDEVEGQKLRDRILNYVEKYNSLISANVSPIESKLGELLTNLGRLETYYNANQKYPHMLEFVSSAVSKIAESYDDINQVTIPADMYSDIRHFQDHVGSVIDKTYPISQLEDKLRKVSELYNKCSDRLDTLQTLLSVNV